MHCWRESTTMEINFHEKQIFHALHANMKRNREPTTDQKNSTACHRRPTDRPPLHAFGLVQTGNFVHTQQTAHVPDLHLKNFGSMFYLVFHFHTFAHGRMAMPSTIEERIFWLHVCSSFRCLLLTANARALGHTQLPAIPFDAMRWRWPLKKGNKLKFRILWFLPLPRHSPQTHTHTHNMHIWFRIAFHKFVCVAIWELAPNWSNR